MGFGNAEIEFACGKRMKNDTMLAPLTNCQSHEDGTLSEDEFHWLTMRAKGQFGMTMTCAAHVQAVGQGFLVSWVSFRSPHSRAQAPCCGYPVGTKPCRCAITPCWHALAIAADRHRTRLPLCR